MSKNNNPYIIDEEEKVTPRVVTEQIVRILCVVGFIFTVAMPLIICDALGSVAGNFATETGIPISAGGGDSQTKFFYGIPYMLKNSTDGFIPFKLFKTGMKWIASNSGVITDIFAGLAIAALIILYVAPVVLYVILMLSRYYEGRKSDGTPSYCRSESLRSGLSGDWSDPWNLRNRLSVEFLLGSGYTLCILPAVLYGLWRY